MSEWITTRTDRHGKTVHVLRTKTIGPDGKVKVTQRTLGRDGKYAKKVKRTLDKSQAFWGAGALISKKTRELRGEIPTLFAGRSEAHLSIVVRTFDMFLELVNVPEHLVDVTPGHVDQFKLALMAKVAPVTVNKHLRSLRAVFGRAYKRGYLLRNPVSMVEFVSEQDKEPREMTFDEMGRFLAFCERPEDLVFFRILAVTGMRTSELARRKWEDLDMETGRLVITGTKTGSARVTFLGEPCRALVLDYWASVDHEHETMFGKVTKIAADKWSRRCGEICARAGLEYYRPKDFRSSYLPRGLELGKRFDVGDRGLGHRPQGVGMKHYNRIDPGLIRDYNEALDEAVEKAYKTAKSQPRDTYVTQTPKKGKSRKIVKDISFKKYAS